MVKAVVAIVAVMVGGCSFATVRGPHGSPPECSESSLAPVVDIGLAIASPFVVYALLSANSDPNQDPDTANLDRFIRGIAAVGLSFPVWGITGASAIYGFVKGERCTRAKRDYQQLMAAPPGPGMYVPPPMAPGPGGGPPMPGPMPGPMPAPPPQQ